MNWNIKARIKEQDPQKRLDQIISAIMQQRGLKTSSDKKAFLSPPSPFDITPQEVGISPTQLKRAIVRIKKAISNKQPIIVFGDYDADGITATGIMWETLHRLGATAHPFIPSRERHGYGLKEVALKDALNILKPKTSNLKPIIITVDNGITAHEAAQYLQSEDIDLIITDHHQPGKDLPPATAIVHTDQIAGSAVAWILAKELDPKAARRTLDLVTIGTVADMLPLKGSNRRIVKTGIKMLPKTNRPGLHALFQDAGVDTSLELSTYHINFIIAPRLNAMGRLEHAIDSLRLLCTTNPSRAQKLARVLSQTNTTRQDLTYEYLSLARKLAGDITDNIIVLEHAEFHEGVIGLVAGKMVEEHYRPSIIISKGESVSKASVRSISGVNIIEMIRTHQEYLLSAGGHPMAAGFSIETHRIEEFKQAIIQHANENIQQEQLNPILDIDVGIEVTDISDPLFYKLEELKPFGIGNSRPTFAVQNTKVVDKRGVGKQKNHLKLTVASNNGQTYSAIGFRLADTPEGKKLLGSSQDRIDAAFTIDENIWNGRRELQLKLKDIKVK